MVSKLLIDSKCFDIANHNSNNFMYFVLEGELEIRFDMKTQHNQITSD